MIIENLCAVKHRIMKKNFEKMVGDALKKNKQQSKQVKKLKLSSFKEDFVITEQEEREGGFFGNSYYKTVTT